jgi:hypothetical protein
MSKRIAITLPPDLVADVDAELARRGIQVTKEGQFNEMLIYRYRMLLDKVADQEQIINRLATGATVTPQAQPDTAPAQEGGDEWNTNVW